MTSNKTIDYRSDTVTKPTPAMLQAMIHAQVGDDVYGEDPTANALEAKTALLFGKEAAIFCPSGTMTNQIALKLHTQPCDEVICDSLSHIYLYEGGGMAGNAGIQPRLLLGDYGRITAQQIEEAINPEDIHKARTSLVSLENTSNRGGGSCYNWDELVAIKKVCLKHNLKLHLDGARIFNALVATGITAPQMGEIFDTISICLSKGLGAPIGSLLVGSHEEIKQARRLRKRFGGAMRQAGFIAAAGIYALDNHIERLQTDHDFATALAQCLSNQNFVDQIYPVATNIVIFSLVAPLKAQDFASDFKQNGVLLSAISANQIRLVTHLDISKEDLEKTISLLQAYSPKYST
jgi:threonine aldolase